ncbi:hypothetical protein PIB30_081177 [Stylosanthes scabra]|uniref:Uncharacterized protein n=1 Tax=Stylosanthes scabra TaxID=79078 RepID=A0ABU6QSB4_9FABA|nr:hypothetical protein [Stylosanthes scabra]
MPRDDHLEHEHELDINTKKCIQIKNEGDNRSGFGLKNGGQGALKRLTFSIKLRCCFCQHGASRFGVFCHEAASVLAPPEKNTISALAPSSQLATRIVVDVSVELEEQEAINDRVEGSRPIYKIGVVSRSSNEIEVLCSFFDSVKKLSETNWDAWWDTF